MIENMVLTSYLDRCFLLVMTPDSSLFLKYYYNIPSEECVFKSTSLSYVQNTIKNMILTSYLDRCFLLVMTPDSSLFLKYYYKIPSD